MLALKQNILRSICFLVFVYNFGAIDANNVEEVFKQHQVVPDVIPTSPNQFLKVVYESGEVIPGAELTPTQVQSQPSVKWDAKDDCFYTIILSDPDAPSRTEPKVREFKHWLVGNIPGNNVDAGEVVAAYIGSGAPKGTGLHRYVFLLYEQPGKIEFTEPHVPNTSRETRPKFRAAEFADKYNLGQPIAGNFFQAQWDEYVPILQQQLSGN